MTYIYIYIYNTGHKKRIIYSDLLLDRNCHRILKFIEVSRIIALNVYLIYEGALIEEKHLFEKVNTKYKIKE